MQPLIAVMEMQCEILVLSAAEKSSIGRTTSDHCGAQDSHKRNAQWHRSSSLWALTELVLVDAWQ